MTTAAYNWEGEHMANGKLLAAIQDCLKQGDQVPQATVNVIVLASLRELLDATTKVRSHQKELNERIEHVVEYQKDHPSIPWLLRYKTKGTIVTIVVIFVIMVVLLAYMQPLFCWLFDIPTGVLP